MDCLGDYTSVRETQEEEDEHDEKEKQRNGSPFEHAAQQPDTYEVVRTRSQ